MRRFLFTSLILLALVVSATGAAPVAHAQTSCPTGQSFDAFGDCATNAAIAQQNAQSTAANLQAGLTATGEATAAQNAAASAARTAADYKADDTDSAYDGIMIKIMSLFAWLVGIAMITLNYAMFYTVVTMGEHVHNLSAIGVAWRILRDVANIMLIFGFIGAGIATILNVDQYGWKTKMLPMLLVAAIFLNFSLFISEAMIDATNLFATQFYKQINGGKLPTVATLNSEGISDKIMSQLGLQTIYGQVKDPDSAKQILKGGSPWITGFMGILLFIVLAFVLFSLAFILIARFVALIFFILLSPVGFMGLAIPGMKFRAGQWWSNFLEQIVTAPVLMLLLYVALAVITDAQFLTGFGSSQGADWLGTVKGNIAGFAPVLLSFLVAMGLLLVVVIKAKSMSAFGAKHAINLGGKLSFGATAWAGRATVGTVVGRGLLGNRFIKKGAVSDNALIKYGSRALSFTGKRLQNRTFDLRNIPGAKAGLGAMTVDAGTPSALTAKQLQEKQYGAKPVKEFFRQSDIEHEQAAAELERKRILGDPASTSDAIARELSKMTTKEIEELGGIKNGVEKLVSNLSPQQFEALMKSDKLSEVEKGRIKTTRYKPLEDARSSGNTSNIKKAVSNLSKGELESMPANILADTNVLEALSDKQRETIADSKERTATEKNAVRNSSKVGKVEVAFDDPARGPNIAASMISGLTPQQVAKLKTDVLKDQFIAQELTPAMLGAIMRENKLLPRDIADIKGHIMAGGHLSSINYITTGPAAQMWS